MNLKRLSNKELILLNTILNSAYAIADNKITNRFSRKFKINKDASRIISRRSLVPLIHFFFDRFLRLSKNGKQKKKLTNIEKFNFNFNKIEDFHSEISEEYFNEYFFNYLKKNFYGNLKNKNKKIKNKIKSTKSIKNNLFLLNDANLCRFFLLFEKYFFKFVPGFFRIPTLHLSQLQNSFDPLK